MLHSVGRRPNPLHDIQSKLRNFVLYLREAPRYGMAQIGDRLCDLRGFGMVELLEPGVG